MSKFSIDKRQSRARRAAKTKAVIRRNNQKRLVVYKSLNHIYAQIVEATEMGDVVLAASSTIHKDLRSKLSGSKTERAYQVGKHLGELAQKTVKEVAFDRNGYRYHGCVKSLADGAREAGLDF